MEGDSTSTRQKALVLNLDATRYGTFPESGGGQEVARWFFSVGGAAGTIAETISAYDMAMSDRRYGPAKRYVSRERLEAMLKHEFAQLLESLNEKRGETKRFFAFANTVATLPFIRPETGVVGSAFAFKPGPAKSPSEIIIHTHLLDSTAAREQEALGILGVNLVHAAFFHCECCARPGRPGLPHETLRRRQRSARRGGMKSMPSRIAASCENFSEMLGSELGRYGCESTVPAMKRLMINATRAER